MKCLCGYLDRAGIDSKYNGRKLTDILEDGSESTNICGVSKQQDEANYSIYGEFILLDTAANRVFQKNGQSYKETISIKMCPKCNMIGGIRGKEIKIK
jgi:hypothetical protein